MAQMQMTLAEQLKQSAGQSDLGLQIQRLKQVASAEQQALVAQSSQRLGQGALALRDNYRTPQERAQAAQQLLPPQVAQALPQGFDFSDQSLTAMAQMQMTLAEQLKQSETEVTKFGDSLFGTWTNNITRDMQVEELGQRGPTYSEKTGRQNADAATLNADTSRGRLELDVQNAGRQGSRPPSVKPLTEREGRFGMFARVASEANQILSSIETQNNFDPTLIVPDRGNMARSPDAQQYLAEKSAFIDAIIRPKTGAAVTEYEFSAAEKRYFPQFGDSPQTVQNKAALRQREIDALLLGAGRGSSIAEAAQQASQGGDSDPLGIR